MNSENMLTAKEAQQKKELVRELKNIVLYNDDINTFDFVIESLIKVCKQELLQAEQCTYIVHYNGKCVVKTGTFEKLKPLCIELLDRGLTVAIE